MARPVDTPPKGDRIAKLLARAGIASRREIERMIADGRVVRDGEAIDTPATVLSSLAGVTVDGSPVAAPEPARLFLYHKPPGLLVTERDPAGRPTIYDKLPADLPRLVPVGRLDRNTEGLLLLTTDGGFKRQLELPATGVERSYRARAYGPVTQGALEALIEGIEIDGFRYGPIDANMERRTGANSWIELTLAEGKNREVRRVLEHLGLEVSRLIRTRYGPFVLGDLPPGAVGEVRQADLVAFRATLDGRKKWPDRIAVSAETAADRPLARGVRLKPQPKVRGETAGARRFPGESRGPGAARAAGGSVAPPQGGIARGQRSKIERQPAAKSVARLGHGLRRGSENTASATGCAFTRRSRGGYRAARAPREDRAQGRLGQAEAQSGRAGRPRSGEVGRPYRAGSRPLAPMQAVA